MPILTYLENFFAMGGYAFFVWTAYCLVIVTLGGLFAQSWRRSQRINKLILKQCSSNHDTYECKT